MNQAPAIKLPFQSRVLIQPDALLMTQWTLPRVPDELLFVSLPKCLHDRHAMIRERLLAEWREPIADVLRQQLQTKFREALRALEHRLAAWTIALDLPIVFDGCKFVQKTVADITDELFRADGVEMFLKPAVATLARNTRNFSTAHWLDREYVRIIDLHTRNASQVLAMVLKSSRMQSRFTSAIRQDVNRLGMEMDIEGQSETLELMEKGDRKPNPLFATAG